MKHEKLRAVLDRAVAFGRRRPKTAAGVALGVLLALVLMMAGGGEDEAWEFHEVTRGDFLVSIVEGGTLEAVNEKVVRNEVEGTSRVIFIVPEGSYVNEGDLLVELDAGEAEVALNQQQITYEKSLADFIAAQNNRIIMESTVESEIRAAELAVQFADMDLKKFKELDHDQQKRDAEIAIITAQAALVIAEDKLENTVALEKKGYESKNQLALDKLDVTERSLALEQAENTLKMLEAYDLEKLAAEFVSTHEEAIKELERVTKQGESQLAQADADLSSAEKTLELNKTTLDKMKEQFTATKIYAPQDGLVVYATGESRFSSESMIEEGAQVRNRQELIKIPDTSEMKVSVKVHESHISQVSVGQPAFVVLDSQPDRQFRGQVTKVAILPDSQSRWSNPNLKVYSTEVVISEELEDIKPGVSARAEIVITNLKNVITVPIQAVTTAGGQLVCFVDKLGGPQPVPVEVGLYNTKSIEVTSGLNEGDRVLLSPPVDTSQELDGAVLADTEGLDLPSDRPEPRSQANGGPGGFGAPGGTGGPEAGGDGDGGGRRPGAPGGSEGRGGPGGGGAEGRGGDRGAGQFGGGGRGDGGGGGGGGRDRDRDQAGGRGEGGGGGGGGNRGGAVAAGEGGPARAAGD